MNFKDFSFQQRLLSGFKVLLGSYKTALFYWLLPQKKKSELTSVISSFRHSSFHQISAGALMTHEMWLSTKLLCNFKSAFELVKVVLLSNHPIFTHFTLLRVACGSVTVQERGLSRSTYGGADRLSWAGITNPKALQHQKGVHFHETMTESYWVTHFIPFTEIT